MTRAAAADLLELLRDLIIWARCQARQIRAADALV